MNLYPLYLASDLLKKRLAAVGLTPLYFIQGRDYDGTEGGRGMHVGARIDYYDAAGVWITKERVEELAGEFALRYPDATIVRSGNADEYSRPTVAFRGVTTLGVAWKIEFGETVCERVQVGTKSVERVDLKAYAALPKVFVEEPVYQYRCSDPLAGVVSA